MSRGPIKGNTRKAIQAYNFEKSLEYKAKNQVIVYLQVKKNMAKNYMN